MTTDIFNLVGQTLEGKYAIEAVVAEGGFGVVYKALHRTLNKPVALKVLKLAPDLTASARAAFLEGFALEAQTIARLEHPAIVKVLDFGTSEMPVGGMAPWMVLEWLTGTPFDDELKARLGRGGRAPQACFEMLRPILEAVAVAHDAGVVHRDIKPANIMLLGATGRGGPSLRLLDFGIAKIMNPDEKSSSGQTTTQSALLAFSLPYAAPEQISATRTGPWTDVHALALVLTEMLTDARAYDSGDNMEVHLQVLASVRPTPAKRGVDVGAWEPVLQKALAIRPGDRYQNAGELLDALAGALAGASHRATGLAPAAAAVTPDTVAASTLTPMVNPSAGTVRTRRRPVLIGASIAALILGGLALGVYALIRPESPPVAAPVSARPTTRPAATAALTAPPTRPAVVPAAPLVPAAPVAPAPTPQPVAPNTASPPAQADASTAGDRRERHGHRRHRRHDSERDPEVPSIGVIAPPNQGNSRVLVTPD